MWVSRIPLPIRYKVDGIVNEDFNELETGGAITDWIFYAPQWSPIDVVEFPNTEIKVFFYQTRFILLCEGHSRFSGNSKVGDRSEHLPETNSRRNSGKWM